MGAKASTVRPAKLTGILLALVPATVVVAGASAIFGWNLGSLIGLAVFVAYRLMIVRRIVCADHRRGVVLSRRGKFDEAIAAFKRSQAFWARHGTLDRFRAPLLGSAVTYPFHVLAQYNQAYCLSRMGQGDAARVVLSDVLAQCPNMLPARELSDVLDAGRNVATGEV